jgi:hypothetical protein
MARPRQFGLQHNVATGACNVTLPNSTFKYFFKDRETAQQEYAVWLLSKNLRPRRREWDDYTVYRPR